MLFSPMPALAAGSATIGFDGNSNVNINENITIQMYVSNVSGTYNDIGAASVGGKLTFDTNYLQLVSYTATKDPYRFQFNEDSNMLAGVDTSLEEGIKSKTTVLTFTFKAIKEGTTKVTVNEVKITDAKKNVLATTVVPKNITIGQKPEVKDATLSSLSVDGYSISPNFNANTTNYTLTVPNHVSSINIKATAKDNTAQVTGTGSKSLVVGKNNITVKVTATDGTSKSYTLTVTRQNTQTSVDPKPDNPDDPKPIDPTTSSNDLSNLSVDGYNISPIFDKDILEYTITVPNNLDKVTIQGTKVDSNAIVTGLGEHTLEEGNNQIKVTVKDKGGKEKTYVINVKRDDSTGATTVLADATLKSLDISGYTLSPEFNSKTNYYRIPFVANTVTGLNVKAIPNDPNAQVDITGNLGWHEGINNITIRVTATDGTTNMYIVAVNRASANGELQTLSSDNFLNSLTLGNGLSLNEAFNRTQGNYSITVPYDVTSLNLNTITNSTKAKVDITGNENFEVGKVNVVSIAVTAEDGGIRYYTINVIRSSKSSAYDLKTLEVAGHSLMPRFDKSITEYNLTVDGKTEYLDVTALAENPNAKVEITGNTKLSTGKNVILVKVTDESGFSKIYQINVTKEPINTFSILGMSLGQFLLWLFLLLLLLIIFLILLFRKKDKEEKPQTPIIEFKPEFNFGSKNTNDNDTVEGGGTLYQNSAMGIPHVEEVTNQKEEIPFANYTETTKEIPYDPYDEIVTKDELYNAILEKDAAKLKVLMEQEALNRRKEELKKQEEDRRG